MKRHGGLWEELIGFPNLWRAARKATKGKRRRPNVARFHFDLEDELCRLHEELAGFTYLPGPFRTFKIYEPKERLISAAPYRDRVVHHALCNLLEPIFEPRFIFDSYGCRKDKGTHAAVRRCQAFTRRFRYVWKADVAKFFPSIDHQVLKALLARKVKDPAVLWLAGLIIDHGPSHEPAVPARLDGSGARRASKADRPPLLALRAPEPSSLAGAAAAWFPGDDLFTPGERARGLPIGNQTSQFFANVYLDGLDHFLTDHRRVGGYVRYVDDFVAFADSKEELRELREGAVELLAELRLRLHPTKDVIFPAGAGIAFLGYRVFPTHRLLAKANVWRFRRRLRRLQRQYVQRQISFADVVRRTTSWVGHARQADTFRLRSRLFREHPFRRAPTD